MNAHSPTFSIRLPQEQRESLETAIKLTRRSRSFIVKEALERHLPDIIREQSGEAPKRRLTHLLSLAGAGVRKDHVRTREEIDAHIRWLRDNE
jgi:predicted transcriptional regulator